MTQRERVAVDEIVARLKMDHHAEQVFLYGSAARGQLEDGSDIDLLAVLPKADWETKKHVCDLCFDYELNLGRIISVVCIESSDFNSPVRRNSPFLVNVRNEGVVQ